MNRKPYLTTLIVSLALLLSASGVTSAQSSVVSRAAEDRSAIRDPSAQLRPGIELSEVTGPQLPLTNPQSPISNIQSPISTSFTYQGRLDENGSPAEGAYDFEFKLFDALSGGNQVGPALTPGDVPVSGGLFTVPLDFGDVFSGDARYLEMGVRPGSDTGAYTTISPRQEITPTPYALHATSAITATTATAAPWSGLSGVPAGFADNVDDDTTYAAGTGLDLSGTTFSLDLAFTDDRYSGGAPSLVPLVGDWDGDGTETPGLFDPTSGFFLLRNSNDAGDPDLMFQFWPPAILSLVDSGVDAVGQYTSIATGADGLGLVSYYDNTNTALKVAHCEDPACASATLTTLDSAGEVGEYTSIAIGADGMGLISYYDVTNGDLKVAHCDNPACTSATLTTLDSVGDVGQYTSIAIGDDGLGLISYYDVDNGDVKVAHCANTACSSATLTTLDTAGGVGLYTSIAIGADGLGLISYYDSGNADLKVARCHNTACSSATLTTLDSAGFVGAYTSIAIGADGLGLISYFDNTNYDLKVARLLPRP